MKGFLLVLIWFSISLSSIQTDRILAIHPYESKLRIFKIMEKSDWQYLKSIGSIFHLQLPLIIHVGLQITFCQNQ